MRYLPIGLDIKNKQCLVVGGGKVAERKIKTLLNFGAKVLLVSPKISLLLAALVKRRKIKYVRDIYRKKYLESAFLVIAATKDKSVNKSISQDTIKKHILINCVDDKENSNFISPAILKGKGFTVAVSTDGLLPKRAQKIRDRIKDEFNFSRHKS